VGTGQIVSTLPLSSSVASVLFGKDPEKFASRVVPITEVWRPPPPLVGINNQGKDTFYHYPLVFDTADGANSGVNDMSQVRHT
jgi:hypothetical protein